MIEMRRRMCQDLTFFTLAVLLLLICGSCSAAQQGETSGSQMGGNSPTQIATASGSQTGSSSDSLAGGNTGPQASSGSGFQVGGNSGPQAGDSSGPQTGGNSDSQAGSNSGSQAGSGSGSQTGGNTGSQADIPPASQMGERSRSQIGGANSPSLNASSGKGAQQATANGAGRGDVDVQNWRGTASKDDESYPVRLNVESILTLDPDVARNLLSSNLSLEDIRSQLGSGNRDTILRGSLRISNDSYRLVNVSIESSFNNSTLRASLAGPSTVSGSGDQAGIVGHISVAISADDLNIARGYAVIDDPRYRGTYSIELKRQSGRGYMWGMPGRKS